MNREIFAAAMAVFDKINSAASDADVIACIYDSLSEASLEGDHYRSGYEQGYEEGYADGREDEAEAVANREPIDYVLVGSPYTPFEEDVIASLRALEGRYND